MASYDVASDTCPALVLGGVPFFDNRIEFAEWTDMKPTTPFGQLPLLSIDGKGLNSSTSQLNLSRFEHKKQTSKHPLIPPTPPNQPLNHPKTHPRAIPR
jgi:hypothetical protein